MNGGREVSFYFVSSQGVCVSCKTGISITPLERISGNIVVAASLSPCKTLIMDKRKFVFVMGGFCTF